MHFDPSIVAVTQSFIVSLNCWLSSHSRSRLTTAQVVKTSVTVNNSAIQDYVHPDNHTQQTFEQGSHSEKYLNFRGSPRKVLEFSSALNVVAW